MERFTLNGIPWRVYYVPKHSLYLVDRTGNTRLATTDIRLHTIYIYEGLSGELLLRVTAHEMGHAVMESYHLTEELHAFVMPEYWLEAEEWVCNFVADYGLMILDSAKRSVGNKLDILAQELDFGFG